MDENTSPVSTPGSENSSSVRERFSPLQSKTNKSRYEIKSDGGKRTSTATSPCSPLSEKNASILTPPSINRQILDKSFYRSPSPTEKPRQHKFQLHINGDDVGHVNQGVRPLKQQQQHPTHSNYKADNKLLTSPPSPKASSHGLDSKIKAQQLENDTLKTTLEKERQHTAWMMTLENTMVQLMDQFKELQVDVDDSVDILVESDQVLSELALDTEKQAQVDELMNLVPQRLFEIEELKSKLAAEQ